MGENRKTLIRSLWRCRRGWRKGSQHGSRPPQLACAFVEMELPWSLPRKILNLKQMCVCRIALDCATRYGTAVQVQKSCSLSSTDLCLHDPACILDNHIHSQTTS